jgi:hypothetical protein
MQGDIGHGPNASGVPSGVVPEPGMLTMLAVGGLGLLAFTRRK